MKNMILRLLKREGLYSNHPDDRGGATYMGISSKYFPKEFEEIMSLPVEQREDYAIKFYEKNFIANIPDNPFQEFFFDCYVHHGFKRAVKIFQLACNIKGSKIERDGIWGNETQKAIDIIDLQSLKIARASWFGYLLGVYPEQKEFFVGWLRRLDKI